MDNEKLSILRLLIGNQEENLSIRQIALKRKINYKSAYNAVRKLEKEGVIDLKKHGNTMLCKFNLNFNASVFIVEYAKLQELLENKNFRVIYNRISSINSQFIMLLFGSYVRKENTKYSDIDILSVSDNRKEIEKEVALLPFKIHFTAVNYKDFIAMLKSKEMTVVSEAVKKNIILFGIEDYYRLIKNAG
jgi:predicted nucleotidyltransferase